MKWKVKSQEILSGKNQNSGPGVYVVMLLSPAVSICGSSRMCRLTCKQEYFHSCRACKHLIWNVVFTKEWTLMGVSQRLWTCPFVPRSIRQRRRLAVAGQRPAPPCCDVYIHTFPSLFWRNRTSRSSKLEGYETFRFESPRSAGLTCVSSLIDRPSLSLSLHHLCFSLSSSHLFSIFWPAPLSAFVRPFLCLFTLLTAGFWVLRQNPKLLPLCSVSLSTFLHLVAPLVCRRSRAV